MNDLYARIARLCDARGVNMTGMCRDAGVSRAALSDLKAERKQQLSATTLTRIAAYFGVSVDFLLREEQTDSFLALAAGELGMEDAYRALLPDENRKERFLSEETLRDAMLRDAPPLPPGKRDALWADIRAYVRFRISELQKDGTD